MKKRMENTNYRVLTIPTKKVLVYDHVYYKEYNKEDKELIEIPEKRTLYAVRFDQPFTGDYVKKYFGLAGKVQTAHMGEYKHRSNNKKRRRQLWFAIVVYKKAEDFEKAMDGHWLQKEVNKKFGDGKGKWQITFNPEGEESPDKALSPEEQKQREELEKMEEGGFTVMLPGKGKRYVSDGATSMKVISKAMIDSMMGKNKKKQEQEPESGHDFYEETARRKRKKMQANAGFYMYETKEQKKKELEELRKGLDEDMKLVAAMKNSSTKPASVAVEAKPQQ
ncbi:MAG: hypothetical protein P4L67_05260 [Candidatus Pacebacteria bacterium]|nr:hypothetical protein [Candidatus Paceibacterota bacterium]